MVCMTSTISADEMSNVALSLIKYSKKKLKVTDQDSLEIDNYALISFSCVFVGLNCSY